MNGTSAGWRTELQLDILSNDDKASLIKWMAYIKALDLSGVSVEAGFNAITWTDKPQVKGPPYRTGITQFVSRCIIDRTGLGLS